MLMLPPAAKAKEASNSASNAEPQAALMQSIMSAMATAINGGLYTCTASIAGKTAFDVQQVLQVLRTLGYSYSISVTTLTVKWSGAQ